MEPWLELYAGTPVWEWDPTCKGYRGRLPTAAEDFRRPYLSPEDYDLL